MSSNVYKAGLRNVGSYQVSGTPYVKRQSVNPGEEVKIEFPYVAKNIKIRIPSPPNVGCDNSPAGNRFQTDHSQNTFNLGGAGKDYTLSLWHKNTAAFSDYNNKNRRPIALTDGASFQNGIVTPRPNYTNLSGTFHWNSFGVGGNNVNEPGYWTQPNGNDEWYHFLVTQNTGSVTIYTNGVFESSKASNDPNWTNIQWFSNGGPLRSAMDEIMVWNTGFSTEDVQELYNYGEYYNPLEHPKVNNLEAYYTMGDNALDHPGPRVSNVTGRLHDVINADDDMDFFVSGAAAAEFIPGGFETKQTVGKIRVHLLSTGSASGTKITNNRHYYELQGYKTSIDLPVKTKEIYITGVGAQTTFEITAELTNIPTNSMYALTGSGIDE